MRRRTQVLVLIFGAAAALLVSAPALGAPTLIETNALFAANIQHSPAIAIDPSAPSRAVVMADDGTIAPPPHTVMTTTTNWAIQANWAAAEELTHSGSFTAGQPALAWGIDGAGTQNVYAVDLGSSGGSLCMPASGIFFSASDDGGLNYDTPLSVANGSTVSQLVEPAIAVDRTLGRVYIAYARLDYGQPNCQGTPDGSQIWLAYGDIGTVGFGTSWTTRRASPLATSGSARYRSPALAVLPDGRVVVAFRNDATAGPQIETVTCISPTPPGGHYCGAPSAGSVGPSTVLGDATAPALVSGLVGPPTPSVAAVGGRVTVAWHAGTAGGVRAFAAMSTDGGATFGQTRPIDPAGPGNQVAPQLATTAQGRVDVAYLWDTGSGAVQATTVSAAAPLAGATTEAWAQPVVVQAVPAGSATPISGQAAPLGRGLGIATSAVPASPLPATVVAFTDTQAGQDVHVVGQYHGTTAPVIGAQTVQASKNTSTTVQVSASDEDGDPLMWSAGAQPVSTPSTVEVSDAARGEFLFKAADIVGTDTFEAVARDGAGNEARRTINVNIVNDPPEIICPSLATREDTPLDVPVAACVRDLNKDPITMTLDRATGGTVERVAGVWRFVPAVHSTATGSFRLRANDGDKEVEAIVTVTIAKAIGKVTLDVKGARTRTIARGMSLRFGGTAVDSQGRTSDIIWRFGDGAPLARGRAVAHRFRRDGVFLVTASVSGAVPVKIKVLVRRRAVEIRGAPRVVDGVLQVQVRTRAAGQLSIRVDSRSRTIATPAGSALHTLRIQVTTGPLVRLTLRLQPGRKTALPALSVRRLVIVSPLSAG
jgi:Bacterial Ig domain/PKD domain